jgi:O-antigen/teichoic acid export membrane protein
MRALAGRAAMLVLSLGFAVALARALRPDARGLFALMQSLTGIVAVLANLAIGKAILHHVGKGLLPVHRAGGIAATLALASGVGAAVIFVPVSLGLKGSLLPGLTSLYIVVSIALVTPILFREYIAGAMFSIRRPLDYLAAIAAQPLLGLLALLVFLALGRPSLSAAVIAWTVGTLASATVAWTLTVRYSPAIPSFSPDELGSLSRFGLRTYPAFIARFLNLRVDQILVNIFSSAFQLGLYAVAVNVGEVLIRIPNIMLWAFSGALSVADRRRSQEFVVQFCRWSMLIVGIAAAVIAIMAPYVLPPVFGDRYSGAIGSTLILLPGMVMYAPAIIIVEYFIVQRGKPGKAAIVAASSMAVSVLLTIPLARTLGANGASIASTISYCVMMLVGLVLFAKDSGIPTHRFFAFSLGDLRGISQALRRALRLQPASTQESLDLPPS